MPENELTETSRRDFLKKVALLTTGNLLPTTDLPQIDQRLNPENETADIEFSNEGTYESRSYAAILAACRKFAGHPYSWETNDHHHCSGYVALYLKYLGFKIGPVNTPLREYSPSITEPLPNSTTVKQVPYLKMLATIYGEDLTREIPLKTMLFDKTIWSHIPPGTVLYLPERVGHHGYDTFTHTAIFMGLDPHQEPMFSEFSVYMQNGPEYGHGLEQFTRMYNDKSIEAYTPNTELMVFMFDAVKASSKAFSGISRENYSLFDQAPKPKRPLSTNV